MSLVDWVHSQHMERLAEFAGGRAGELSKILVTEAMKDAAVDYISSLHDPVIDGYAVEDIFRIMATLQPRVLASQAVPLLPSR